MVSFNEACRLIVQEIAKRDIKTFDDLNFLKKSLVKELGIKNFPSNIDLAMNATPSQRKKLKKFLSIKPTRELSGVSVIAVMSKPIPCPHKEGPCTYCPGGLNSYFGDIPQSYTGNEPAALRAKRNSFDAFCQAFNRLEHYVAMNKPIDKIELIIMGGTFPSFPTRYQDSFIRDSLKAMNVFGKKFYKENELNFDAFKDFFMLPNDIYNKSRAEEITKKMLALKKSSSSTLEEEQLKNEKGKARCVALCIETRPDYCREEHIKQMLKLGTTRVELGVQSVYNEVLQKVNRGHSVEDSIEATRLLKDSYLKTCYHIMPGLPDSSVEKDKKMFHELFSNQDFMPDALKIYPLMVMPGTKLFEDYKKGAFKPLSNDEIFEILLDAKKIIPKWCRIMRVQRDIPPKYSGYSAVASNLRQELHEQMRDLGIKCRCIRCREPKNEGVSLKDIEIVSDSYSASKGTEYFISAEVPSTDTLIGFCRLRIPYKTFLPELKDSVGIRELHVYSSSLPLGSRSKESLQHKGLGKKLLHETEEIAREASDAKKISVISGIGARGYYRKFGYKKAGFYMSKRL